MLGTLPHVGVAPARLDHGQPVHVPERRRARRRRRVSAEHLLERVGRPIGPYDYLIAAQSIRHDLTLITANEKEFDKVGKVDFVDNRVVATSGTVQLSSRSTTSQS